MFNQLFRLRFQECFVRHNIFTIGNTSRQYCRLCSLKKFNEVLYKNNFINRIPIIHQSLFELKLPIYKFYSMNSSDDINVNYNQLIKLRDQENVTIIDVREKHELKETGEIPGSYNIPLSELPQALTQVTEAYFTNHYGFSRPEKNKKIVFSCRSGKRSLMAHAEALKAGYTKVLNFSGGWLEWEENSKKK